MVKRAATSEKEKQKKANDQSAFLPAPALQQHRSLAWKEDRTDGTAAHLSCVDLFELFAFFSLFALLFFFLLQTFASNGLLQVQARNACKHAWVGLPGAVARRHWLRAPREGLSMTIRTDLTAQRLFNAAGHFAPCSNISNAFASAKGASAVFSSCALPHTLTCAQIERDLPSSEGGSPLQPPSCLHTAAATSLLPLLGV